MLDTTRWLLLVDTVAYGIDELRMHDSLSFRCQQTQHHPFVIGVLDTFRTTSSKQPTTTEDLEHAHRNYPSFPFPNSTTFWISVVPLNRGRPLLASTSIIFGSGFYKTRVEMMSGNGTIRLRFHSTSSSAGGITLYRLPAYFLHQVHSKRSRMSLLQMRVATRARS